MRLQRRRDIAGPVAREPAVRLRPRLRLRRRGAGLSLRLADGVSRPDSRRDSRRDSRE
jgi:hypothetical protein